MSDHVPDLDEALDDRRVDLEMQWIDVARQAGISLRTLDRVRKGSGTKLTRRSVERALRLEPGAIEAFVAGDRPLMVIAAPDVDEEIVRRLKRIKDLYGRDTFRAAAIRVAELKDEADDAGDISGAG